jgi:hypothetical protein
MNKNIISVELVEALKHYLLKIIAHFHFGFFISLKLVLMQVYYEMKSYRDANREGGVMGK